MQEIISMLEEDNFYVSRKAIYDDIKTLRDNGYDIQIIKGSTMKYHLLNHSLDLVEAKLLYDFIQSTNFLTSKKSSEISDKILNNISTYQKESIIKTSRKNNSSLTSGHSLYIFNDLQYAISNNYMVSFKYFDITLNKKKKYRKEEKIYVLLPYALVLIQQRYYCIFYSKEHNSFSNYRLDKIDNLSIDKVVHEKIPFDIEEHLSKSFNMFAGKPENITIEFDNELLNVVMDQFGLDLMILDSNEKTFTINLTTTISDNFLSWITQFKTKAKIKDPKNIVARYKEHLLELINHYSN